MEQQNRVTGFQLPFIVSNSSTKADAAVPSTQELMQNPVNFALDTVGRPGSTAVAVAVAGSIINNSWLRTMVGRTGPGAYLLGKLDQLKQQRRESSRRRVTEKELRRLNRRIDKLLTKLDDADVQSDVTLTEDEECVICLSAPATMQTFPCAHRVACRRCFVRTIQTAIAERSLPLRCVVCRSRILKLNDPVDPSPITATAHDRLYAGGVRPMAAAVDRKMAASSAALPAINPLLARSTVVNRGADKRMAYDREVKFNVGSKIVERRLMVPLHRHP